MKLRVLVDGRPIDLELHQNGTACRFRAGSESVEQEASLIEVEPGVYSVLLEGQSYEVKVVRGESSTFVDVRGRHFEIQVQDPRRFTRRSTGLAGEGRQQVAAPMPGKVVRLLVAEGDAVEAGQGLLVVEAMKMQNEMRAPRAGRVVSLPVEPGATVSAGQVLAVLE